VKQNAFTLAEIMIVLVVIGILTAILLPAGFQSAPDENIMKFKKANTTLYRVINELVNSDKYYKDGDLGIRPNGTLIDGTHEGDYTYFCNSIADIVSTKSVDCSDKRTNNQGYVSNIYSDKVAFVDNLCKIVQADEIKAEITMNDGVVIYSANPQTVFGATMNHLKQMACYDVNGTKTMTSSWCDINESARAFGGSHYKDSNGFDNHYIVVCLDVDGIGKGEDPFGYGIRADGKIITGARADAWLQKSIQEKE